MIAINLLFLAALGCKPTAPRVASAPVQAEPSPPITIDFHTLKPEAFTGPTAVLRLGGAKLPVSVETSLKNGVLKYDLRSHDVSLESEAYDVRTSQFSLTSYGLETFTPMVPLLKDGLKSGDKWTWSGTVKEGNDHPATADLTLRSEPLTVGETQAHAVLVEMKLKLQSGGPTPSERKLAFWFVPGKGLLKREMGSGSVREPAGP